MRTENYFKIAKKLWFAWKIITWHKIYISMYYQMAESDFVIFKIDWIEKRFLCCMFLNLTFYMSYDGELKRLFFYKEKKFKVLLKKLNDNKYDRGDN
jgi:hypothetical protein